MGRLVKTPTGSGILVSEKGNRKKTGGADTKKTIQRSGNVLTADAICFCFYQF
jgi:hypothetical protein